MAGLESSLALMNSSLEDWQDRCRAVEKEGKGEGGGGEGRAGHCSSSSILIFAFFNSLCIFLNLSPPPPTGDTFSARRAGITDRSWGRGHV